MSTNKKMNEIGVGWYATLKMDKLWHAMSWKKYEESVFLNEREVEEIFDEMFTKRLKFNFESIERFKEKIGWGVENIGLTEEILEEIHFGIQKTIEGEYTLSLKMTAMDLLLMDLPKGKESEQFYEKINPEYAMKKTFGVMEYDEEEEELKASVVRSARTFLETVDANKFVELICEEIIPMMRTEQQLALEMEKEYVEECWKSGDFF